MASRVEKEKEKEERDRAAAVTQQSISWNRRHTTQIPDCHQPSAREKSRYVKEQIGRMVAEEGKESEAEKAKRKCSTDGKQWSPNEFQMRNHLFSGHAAQSKSQTTSQ